MMLYAGSQLLTLSIVREDLAESAAGTIARTLLMQAH
jgi:hypothetical protein